MTDPGQLSLIDGPSAPVLDISEGRRRRDVGTARVLENSGDWKDQAAEVVRFVASSLPSFISDDVRAHAALRGVPEPPNANAWGAAIRSAERRGWVVWTGQVAQSNRPEAHARLVKVWRGTARAMHPAGRGA